MHISLCAGSILFMALVWIFLCHIVSNFKGCLSYPLCGFFTLASSFPILFQTEAALSHSGRDGALSSEWRCRSAGDRHFHCNQKATTILTLNVMIQTYGFQIEMWREDEGGKKKETADMEKTEEEWTITGSFPPSACKLFFGFYCVRKKEVIAVSELQDAH